MAKKKESLFKSWDEVDNSLKLIGELEIEKAQLEGDLNLKLNEIKSTYIDKIDAIKMQLTSNKKEIERFCEQNKACFLNKRNKKLNFGTVAYRLSEKVVIACADATIKALKSLNLDFCLRIKEEIDKDSLKELDSTTLTKIGVKIAKDDKLTIEPNMVKIATKAGG